MKSSSLAWKITALCAMVAIALPLSSCKSNVDESKTAAQIAASQAKAASAFDAPLKPTGTLNFELITNGIVPFWSALGKGMDDEKAKLGCNAKWLGPQNADNNSQKQIFEDAIASNVNGIGISVIQADAFAPVINSAIRKGIPVVTFDSDSPTSDRLAYIGTNNYNAGVVAGEQAIKLFPNGGNLVAFVGNMSAQNARDRYQGFLDAVKGHNIHMLQDPYVDNKDAGKARNNVADAITKYGDKINGMVGLYSYDGPAIVDEVVNENLRSKIKIMCFDGDPMTLKDLQKGLVDFTVVQQPYEEGRITTKLLYLINREGFKKAMQDIKPMVDKLGMKMNGNIIDTGVKVITPANADEFIQQLHALGLTTT
jgi:ribose transport system substrate-binding protein